MNSQQTPKPGGFDAPKNVQQEDALDRWRFATDVVRIVRNTSPDWSVRIGIFAKWGEGKSTVLRFAEQMLKQDGDLVLWFNPWAIRNWADLWIQFSNTLPYFRQLAEGGQLHFSRRC